MNKKQIDALALESTRATLRAYFGDSAGFSNHYLQKTERGKAIVKKTYDALEPVLSENALARELEAALISTIVPLEALFIAHGDQFHPDTMAAIREARRLTIEVLKKTEELFGEFRPQEPQPK